MWCVLVQQRVRICDAQSEDGWFPLGRAGGCWEPRDGSWNGRGRGSIAMSCVCPRVCVARLSGVCHPDGLHTARGLVRLGGVVSRSSELE